VLAIRPLQPSCACQLGRALDSGEPGFGALACAAVYGPDRYPYLVRFDCGYEDVYAQSDLTEVADCAVLPREGPSEPAIEQGGARGRPT
jgi:hypothetical protein